MIVFRVKNNELILFQAIANFYAVNVLAENQNDGYHRVAVRFKEPVEKSMCRVLAYCRDNDMDVTRIFRKGEEICTG